MIFTVYADKAEEVSKRLDKLAKKATRYNVPFSYTVSDEHPETVNVFDDFSHKAGSYKVAAVPTDRSKSRRTFTARQTSPTTSFTRSILSEKDSPARAFLSS